MTRVLSVSLILPAFSMTNGMRGDAFIGQEVRRLCSLSQRCKRLFLPAPIYENPLRKKNSTQVYS